MRLTYLLSVQQWEVKAKSTAEEKGRNMKQKTRNIMSCVDFPLYIWYLPTAYPRLIREKLSTTTNCCCCCRQCSVFLVFRVYSFASGVYNNIVLRDTAVWNAICYPEDMFMFGRLVVVVMSQNLRLVYISRLGCTDCSCALLLYCI